jgi:hypothetical protein
MAELASTQSPESVQTERYADGFLVEWTINGEQWVETFACEANAIDKAERVGGTCKPLYRVDKRDDLLARFVEWLDRADDPADDCCYLNNGGWDDIRALAAEAREGMA